MECLIAIGTWVAGKVADYTVAPVCHKLGYIFHYRRNLGNLITETQDLNLQKKRLEDSVDAAISNGEEVYEDVKDWLNKAGQITQQTEKLLGDENHTTINCTSRGPFPNLVQRYQLSRKAKKMGESVSKIKCEIRFDNISYRPKLQSNFRNKDFISFDTRKEITKRIMEMLEDGNIKMIGVHGMPGAGKTTLVTEIAREALDRRLFNDAIVITVSQTPNLKRIQQEIAEKLDLKLDKEIVSQRALLLQNRLKHEKKFLIILDDVWNEFKLEDIGIVFKRDEKGCKILFTSRFERVLSTKMGVDKIFQLGLLEEVEALNWFNHLVAKSVEKDSEFLRLGNGIFNECARLPVAIETIAGTLKDRDLTFWRTALSQLQSSNLAAIHDDMDKKVYRPIELCYNCLGDEEKSLLLLCGLHKEDESISIENLMRYGIGWGMFEDVDTLQSARDKVDCLVFTIKDRSLLLDGDYHRTVKMHDVIRDVVISIARKSHMHSFTNDVEVKSQRRALEDSKVISLPYGYVPQLHRGGLEYKQLELIWMQQNEASQIPDNFFQKTKILKVLDLFCCDYLEKLPSSLSSLGNLRTLCLHGHHLEDISLIGELKNLEILDLSNSNIKELPAEIGQLTRLRMLDLHGCTQLKVIQPNVISNLTSLEELYMEESFKKWDELQGVNGDKRNASLNELKHLDKLTTLHLEIVNIKAMPKGLFSGKTLEQYKIAIGCELTSYLIENYSRCLELSLHENIQLQEHGLEMFLESTQMLSLNGFGFIGVDNIVYQLDKSDFPELKLFQLKNNHTVQCLINSMEQNHSCSVFGSLEKLLLDNLENLEKICDGELTKESFERLRFIEVQNCNRLKNLLPFSMSKLEKIKIHNCIMMEEIIVSHEEGDNSKEAIGNFPKLCSLRLIGVPRLKSFCSKLKKVSMSEKGKQPVDVDSVTTLFNGKLVSLPLLKKLELSGCNDLTRIWDDQILPSSTSFRNLTELLVKDCDSLEYLFPSANMATSFVQLCSLKIRGCRNMKEIVRNSEKMDKMSIPKLYSLSILNLPRLATFSSEIYIDFPVLTELSMYECHEFSAFISKSEDEKLPSLFNEMVGFPSLKNLYIGDMNKSKIFITADVFAELEVVNVFSCNNLTKIFTSNMQRTLGSLRRLYIYYCEMVEEVFEIQTSSVEEITHDTIPSQLICLSLCDLPKLEYVWGKDPRGTLTFTHLEDVHVSICPSLKSIFPFSVAKGLSKLRNLHLRDCGIEKIVEAVGTTVAVPPEFVFPQLKEMNLECSENLVCFYPGLHTSSWPSLTSLVVKRCEKVKVLASELSSFQEKHVLHDHDSSPIPQPLIFTKFDPFPELEKLELFRCNLEKIWDGELLPNSHFFRKLKRLHVESCGFLKNLFSSAEAANFKQLCALVIQDCMMMEEIISKNEKVDKVQFNKLSCLNFKNLPNLVSFSSEIFVEFPLLTKISINIEDCPKFKTFVSKSEEKDCTTMTSLFNDKVAFPSLLTLEIEGLAAELKMIWQNKVSSEDSFSKLEYVKVQNCNNLVKIFPSSMQRRLHNLKRLEISDCEMVEVVFEIQIMPTVEGTSNIIPSQLIHLSLVRLSELKHVWSKDPQGTLTFPHLQEVTADSCPNLQSIFPTSIAKGLFQLEKLDIEYCGIQEIVAKYQVEEEILETEPPELISADSFCKLKVKVYCCDNLMRIFPWNMQKVLRNLTKLEILYCKMVEVVFEIQTSNVDEETQSGIVIPTQLVNLELHCLSNLKLVWSNDPRGALTFPKLERVNARECHSLKSIFPASVAKGLFQLKTLNISGCGIEYVVAKEVGLETAPPKLQFHQLEKIRLGNLINFVGFYQGFHTSTFPLLTTLIVSQCMKLKVVASEFFNFQETLGSMYMDTLYERHREHPDFNPEIQYDIGVFKLEGLPNLMHLMDESSQGPTTFQNFIILQVLECNTLKNLVPSSISFQNLQELIVSQCNGMLNLISSKTAKSMNRLRKMRISDCQRLTEIIISDHDTEEGGEIDFAKLESLELGFLPSLTSFYSGNFEMGFPNLESIFVEGCFEMQSFSVHGIISTPKLNRLQLDSKTTMEANSTTDINSIIKHHSKTHLADAGDFIRLKTKTHEAEAEAEAEGDFVRRFEDEDEP